MSKKRGGKPQPQRARVDYTRGRTESLVKLAENWQSRELADIAAIKGGISPSDRVAIQKVTKRKTQNKRTKKDRS